MEEKDPYKNIASIVDLPGINLNWICYSFRVPKFTHHHFFPQLHYMSHKFSATIDCTTLKLYAKLGLNIQE